MNRIEQNKANVVSFYDPSALR